jgi:hypothetical protein
MSAIMMVGGHTYLAGEVTAKEGASLIRIQCIVRNTTPTDQFFRLGDISIHEGGKRRDFLAVGYGIVPFAKDRNDIDTVKNEKNQIRPHSDERTITYIFARESATSRLRVYYQNQLFVDLDTLDTK